MDTFEILDVIVSTEAIPVLNIHKGKLGTLLENFDKDILLI